MVAGGYLWLRVTTGGLEWLPRLQGLRVVAGGYAWLPVVTGGKEWLRVVSFGYQCLCVVLCGFRW